MNPNDLTPVELRNGLWYKREDLFTLPSGVNGSKLRACLHLATRARESGAHTIVSAASVHSPQSAMAASVASHLGMKSITVVGGTTEEKAVKHKAIRLAAEQGTQIIAVPVGYNPYLQAAGRDICLLDAGMWQLPYGITTPPSASEEDVEAFLRVGSRQVLNIPPSVRTLVLPFGSGNTAAGVLHGLRHEPHVAELDKIILMGIGPDRWGWLKDRVHLPDVEVELIPLHPQWATYGDKMPEAADGIQFHPTYEGKIIRWAKQFQKDWWVDRDETSMLWIVGGPLR